MKREPKLFSYANDMNIRYLSPENFFHEHIKAYTSRSLSLDSDGLNAFEGIIRSKDTKALWGIVSYPSVHSELGFAIGLAWSSVRKPPGGGPIRRREGFPTWSWVSLVDRIENAVERRYENHLPTEYSAFYVEDEPGQRLRIADVYKRTAGSGALLFSNFGKALFIEGNITQVRLLWSKKAGVCTVHSPKPSLLRVEDEMAWIDGEDAGLLSNIESHPWYAVQLFWQDDVRQWFWYEYHNERYAYWMLVDELEPVRHRIGIIVPSSGSERRGEIRMKDLETQRRLIRIE